MGKEKKKETLACELKGASIYQEEKRTVYAPTYSKNGYILTDSDVRYYSSYVQSFAAAPLIFLLAYWLSKSIILSLLLIVIFLALTIYFFYKDFISQANVILNYKKPIKENYFYRQARVLEYNRITTIIVCCVLLSICLVIYGSWSQYTNETFYLSVACAIISLLYGLMHVYIYFLKKKIDKQQ